MVPRKKQSTFTSKEKPHEEDCLPAVICVVMEPCVGSYMAVKMYIEQNAGEYGIITLYQPEPLDEASTS